MSFLCFLQQPSINGKRPCCLFCSISWSPLALDIQNFDHSVVKQNLTVTCSLYTQCSPLHLKSHTYCAFNITSCCRCDLNDALVSPPCLFLYLTWCEYSSFSSLHSHATVPLTCCTEGVARMPRLSPRRLVLYLTWCEKMVPLLFTLMLLSL
jgi:hypothetical protein